MKLCMLCYAQAAQQQYWHASPTAITLPNWLRLCPCSSVSTAAAPNNLGVLQRVVEVDPGMDDPYGMQRVSVDRCAAQPPCVLLVCLQVILP
jgi:hypothetical protein